MKKTIIHIAPVTPHMSGLYETTREMVYYEQKLGYNSFIFDSRPSPEEIEKIKEIESSKPNKNSVSCPACNISITTGERVVTNQPKVPDWSEDRGTCSVPFEFVIDELNKGGLLVSHSGVTEKLRTLKIPYLHIAHGRPYSSFLIERSGQNPIYSTYEHIGRTKELIGAITLWPEYKSYLELLFPKIYAFDAWVDLEKWKVFDTDYDFNGHKAEINVVCSDAWRLDKDPYHVLNNFRIFNKKYPNSKIHIYGVKNEPGWNCMIGKMKQLGLTGEIMPIVKNLEEIYNAADMLVTPHKIATRTIREAMGCGLQVVGGINNRFTEYNADVEDLDAFAKEMERAYLDIEKKDTRKLNRQKAVKFFDPIVNIQKVTELYEEVFEKGLNRIQNNG